MSDETKTTTETTTTPELSWIASLLSSSSLWKVYNSNDENATKTTNWLPLIVPSIVWISLYLYRKVLLRQSFSKWFRIHSFHHLVAIAMGITSMSIDDDTIFHERNVIFWSLPYFFLDIIDCCMTKEYTYLFHGIMCFTLGMMNYTIPLLQTLRMNSKATLIETSTIVFHRVQQTRDPTTFVIFFLVFTCCRIIWIPYMIYELYSHHAANYILFMISSFFVLQIYWYSKIIKILINGPKKDYDNKKKKNKTTTTETTNNGDNADATTTTTTTKKNE